MDWRHEHVGPIEWPLPTREEFDLGRKRVFPQAHAELMRIPFWEKMVRLGWGGFSAREHFNVDYSGGGPVWTFARMGATGTLVEAEAFEFSNTCREWLVFIGGEYDDSYDPDFMIYNDVVIRDLKGGVWIYGYPYDAFPPTDFHTATRVGDSIYIIGCLGYEKDREWWRTPVYRLDLPTLQISPVETSGQDPGWISSHEARLTGKSIRIEGGRRWTIGATMESNVHRYDLDLGTYQWRRYEPE
jgi:hypothetical protein